MISATAEVERDVDALSGAVALGVQHERREAVRVAGTKVRCDTRRNLQAVHASVAFGPAVAVGSQHRSDGVEDSGLRLQSDDPGPCTLLGLTHADGTVEDDQAAIREDDDVAPPMGQALDKQEPLPSYDLLRKPQGY